MMRKERRNPYAERRTVSGGIDRRRHPRYASRLKVRVLTRERETICFTRSISHDGIFLFAEEPARTHQIIRMRLDLLEAGDELEVLGVVRWSRSRPEALKSGAAPGMGVAFYQMVPAAKERWAEVVGDHEDCLQFEPFDPREDLPPAEPLEIPRRRQARVERALTVSFSHSGRMFQHGTEDVSLGGFFVPCGQRVPLGSRLAFTLFSTTTHEAIRVLGQVVRIDKGPSGSPGIGVEIFRFLDGSKEDLLRVIEPTPEEMGYVPAAESPAPEAEPEAELEPEFDLEIDYGAPDHEAPSAAVVVADAHTVTPPTTKPEPAAWEIGLAETVDVDYSAIQAHLAALRAAAR